jgi:Uma2 family endonuclease
MVALPDRLLMSYEEYVNWESTQEMRHEYCDGEVIAMAGGTRKHNRISGNAFKILDETLADRPCGVYRKNGFKTPCFQHGFILQYSNTVGHTEIHA